MTKEDVIDLLNTASISNTNEILKNKADIFQLRTLEMKYGIKLEQINDIYNFMKDNYQEVYNNCDNRKNVANTLQQFKDFLIEE